MCESHACRLKTLISRIKDNFSRLTHKSRRDVLKNFISLLLITIAKAFKCLQSVRNVWKSLENHRNLQKWLGCFRKSRSRRDKNLTHLTQKKFAGIIVLPVNVLASICRVFACGLQFLQKNVALRLFRFFALHLKYKPLTMGKLSIFITKRSKCKAEDKTLRQRYLEELKDPCKKKQ